jgi:serpin B
MIRAMLIPCALLLLSPASLRARSRAPKKAPGLASVAQGSNQLAVDLYAALQRAPQNRGKNLFLSPHSISTALAMTYAGARGQTAQQMAKVLHFSLPQAELHRAYRALLAATRSSHGNELRVANALWAQRGYPFRGDFIALTREQYGAGLQQVDFKRTEAARKRINQWVEKQTRRRIVDLIPRGVLDALTRLVLTNAIYFKGTWELQFSNKRTRRRPFTLAGGKRVPTPLMEQTARFGYADLGALQALELRYRGGRLSMVVLLPKKTDGLAALEKRLTAARLTGWLRRLARRKVEVLLPRFKATSAFRLGKTLAAMGMPLCFTDQADFTGMAKIKDLKISEVLHKAFVDVNEEGTEAAAATAVVMGSRGRRPQPPPRFRADHPFLFLIRDRSTGAILFMGRLVDPR